MPTTLVSFNAYDPVCTVNSCLNQVIGSLENNPVVQYASCTSLYGSPAVSTVTLAADVALETTTSTLSYTDIIIEVSTTESTALETSTSYASLFETETAYTTTVTKTDQAITTSVWNHPNPNPVQKRDVRKKHRRRGCSAHPTSAVMVSSTQVSSVMPSATPLSSVPQSACTDSAQLYSACSCINAISTVSLVTESASESTSTVHETISTTLTETSTSVVTIAITTVIVQPMTTTLVSTLQTGTTTTTTSTATEISIAPIQTAKATFNAERNNQRHFLVNANGGVNHDLTLGTSIGWIVDGGSPYLEWNPAMTMWLRSVSITSGVVYFQTAEQARVNSDGVPVTCSVDRATGVVSCLSGNGFSTFTMCGGWIYMTVPDWNSSQGCLGLTVRVTPWGV